jgi:hypothetical protein
MGAFGSRNHTKLFSGPDLSDVLERHRAQLSAAIHKESAHYLLSVNEVEYLNFLEEQFSLEPLVIDGDGVSTTLHEDSIRGDQFPSHAFDPDPHEFYKKQVFTFHLPYAGSEELTRCSSSIFAVLVYGYLSEGCICFDIVDFYGDPQPVQQEFRETLVHIRQTVENINRKVNEYNRTLRANASAILNTRRAELRKQAQVAEALGVPIRKTSNLPTTFAIPPVRKKATIKPIAVPGSKSTVPGPTLLDDVYQDILQTIHDTGKAMERHPNTYVGKDEEALRDHFIFILEPRFEGSTTGETFNKSGKTDIPIRHEKSNVFVAECKFWHGRVAYLKAIDQLLSYLIWRDSKTAIICFVDRKEIMPVLAEITKSTQEHSCYVKMLGKRDDSWQIFEFRLPDDPDCKIKLTVLTFHLPPINK